MLQITKIDCPYFNGEGCNHIDAGVGIPIAIDESVCESCAANYKDPATRKDSYPVLNLIWLERVRRRMEVGELPRMPARYIVVTESRAHLPKPVFAKEPVTTERVVINRKPAPIVPDPQSRLEICEDCSEWRGERCKAACSCKTRPRPLADEGEDCPRRLWKR